MIRKLLLSLCLVTLAVSLAFPQGAVNVAHPQGHALCNPLSYSGLSGWYNTTTSLPGLADGGGVGSTTNWLDAGFPATGNNGLGAPRNWSQSTSGNRPILHTSGGPNNKSYVSFDNTDDWVIFSNTASNLFAGAGVIIAVVRPNRNGTGDGNEFGPNFYTNGGYVGLDLFNSGSNQFQFYRYNGGYIRANSTTTYSLGTWYVVAGWYDGTNVNIRVNNDTKVSTAAGTPGSLANTPTMGAASGGVPINSDIAEIDFFNSANETDIASLSACYGAYYGIF